MFVLQLIVMQIVDLMRKCLVEEVWNEVCCLQARSCHSAMTLDKCVFVYVCVSVCARTCYFLLYLCPSHCVLMFMCAAMWGSEPFLCPGPACRHQQPLGQHRWMMSSVGDSVRFCRETLVSCLCIRVCMCFSHCSVYELLSSALHQTLREKRLCVTTTSLFFLFFGGGLFTALVI